MTDHSKNDSWSRTVNFGQVGYNKAKDAEVRTSGSGVYVTITRVDKDGNLDIITLFPDDMVILTETLPDLVKHAQVHDKRIRRQKDQDKANKGE